MIQIFLPLPLMHWISGQSNVGQIGLPQARSFVMQNLLPDGKNLAQIHPVYLLGVRFSFQFSP